MCSCSLVLSLVPQPSSVSENGFIIQYGISIKNKIKSLKYMFMQHIQMVTKKRADDNLVSYLSLPAQTGLEIGIAHDSYLRLNRVNFEIYIETTDLALIRLT